MQWGRSVPPTVNISEVIHQYIQKQLNRTYSLDECSLIPKTLLPEKCVHSFKTVKAGSRKVPTHGVLKKKYVNK